MEHAELSEHAPHCPMLDQQVARCPLVPRTDKRRIPTGRRFSANYNKDKAQGKGNMGMVMVKCPQTGHAIPTGIQTDRENFGRRAVFFSRTRCPICRTDHAWFAREAWVDEPGIRIAPS